MYEFNNLINVQFKQIIDHELLKNKEPLNIIVISLTNQDFVRVFLTNNTRLTPYNTHII